MATYYAVADANWNAASTWDTTPGGAGGDGIPGSGDSADLNTHTVALDADVDLGSGTLTANNGKLTVDLSAANRAFTATSLVSAGGRLFHVTTGNQSAPFVLTVTGAVTLSGSGNLALLEAACFFKLVGSITSTSQNVECPIVYATTYDPVYVWITGSVTQNAVAGGNAFDFYTGSLFIGGNYSYTGSAAAFNTYYAASVVILGNYTAVTTTAGITHATGYDNAIVTVMVCGTTTETGAAVAFTLLANDVVTLYGASLPTNSTLPTQKYLIPAVADVEKGVSYLNSKTGTFDTLNSANYQNLYRIQTGRSGIVYVSKSGSSGNDGLTPSTAMDTITNGMGKVTADGWDIIVGPGTYTEEVDLSTYSGTRLILSGPDTILTSTGSVSQRTLKLGAYGELHGGQVICTRAKSTSGDSWAVETVDFSFRFVDTVIRSNNVGVYGYGTPLTTTRFLVQGTQIHGSEYGLFLSGENNGDTGGGDIIHSRIMCDGWDVCNTYALAYGRLWSDLVIRNSYLCSKSSGYVEDAKVSGMGFYIGGEANYGRVILHDSVCLGIAIDNGVDTPYAATGILPNGVPALTDGPHVIISGNSFVRGYGIDPTTFRERANASHYDIHSGGREGLLTLVGNNIDVRRDKISTGARVVIVPARTPAGTDGTEMTLTSGKAAATVAEGDGADSAAAKTAAEAVQTQVGTAGAGLTALGDTRIADIQDRLDGTSVIHLNSLAQIKSLVFDTITLESLLECVLAASTGKTSVDDSDPDAPIITYNKRDGTTGKLQVTLGADSGLRTASEIL